MTYLCIYHASNLVQPIRLLNHAEDISSELAEIGVSFSQQALTTGFDWNKAAAEVIAEQQDWLAPLQKQHSLEQVELISIAEGDARAAARHREAQVEHVLGGDEWRYFLAGRARMSFHVDQHIYALRCSRGDQLGIPAQMKRWFELGEQPRVAFIRLGRSAADCSPQPTGNAIAAACQPFED